MNNKPIIVALAVCAIVDLIVFIYLLISSFQNPVVSKDVVHSAFFTGTAFFCLVGVILAVQKKKNDK